MEAANGSITAAMVDAAAAATASSPGGEGASAQPAKRVKARRGFAAMSPEKQRELASLGGRASHAGGRGHEWTQEAARAAARKAVAQRVARRAEGSAPEPKSA